MAAKDGGPALHELCVRYREPVLRFIERSIRTENPRRYGSCDAEDLTQDFLAELLAGNRFDALQRREGKFRSYLLGAVKHFLSDRRKHELSARSGGDIRHISVQDDLPQINQPADAVFDRDWARSTIDGAIARLGNHPQTLALLPWLSKEFTADDRTNLATRLGMNDSALKVALHRLRKRFRLLVRESIAQTVESDAEVDAELAYLIHALG